MAKKIDMAALAARLADLNKPRGGGSGVDFLSIKDGRNVLRILPARDDADWFYTEAWVHFGVNKTAENKNGTMVVCPTTHNDKAKCPVCELAQEIRKLSKKKDDQYDKQARSISRKKRVYYNAISRDEDLSIYEKNEEGKWTNTETGKPGMPVKVFASGVGVFKDILGKITDPEYGDITDPDEGLDVIIKRSGTGFNTEYTVDTVRKESPIGFKEWEENLHDLKQFLVCKTYDEIAAILTGDSTDDNEEDKGGDEDKNMDNDPTVAQPPTPSDESVDETQAEILAALKNRRSRS